MTTEFPRRACIDKMTPAERAITDAKLAVEALPPSEHLTAAVILLGKAQEKVADFVDGVPVLHLWWNGYDHAPGETAEDASRWLQAECDLSADDAEGDGWQMVPDDTDMRDGEAPGKPTGETALMFARHIAATARHAGGPTR